MASDIEKYSNETLNQNKPKDASRLFQAVTHIAACVSPKDLSPTKYPGMEEYYKLLL
ncbi:hypothetical protein WA026_008183 [Henosepilachna vigintioctopunctata]|uniref:Uncharacterized protein n=1 Tax=Henosepilachna vigintioctopunctata TaxID=420089 RepID=A0AAW1TKX4_9CUCU